MRFFKLQSCGFLSCEVAVFSSCEVAVFQAAKLRFFQAAKLRFLSCEVTVFFSSCEVAVFQAVKCDFLVIGPLTHMFMLRVSPAELGDSTVYIAFRAAADWAPGSIEPLGHRGFDSWSATDFAFRLLRSFMIVCDWSSDTYVIFVFTSRYYYYNNSTYPNSRVYDLVVRLSLSVNLFSTLSL